VVQPGEPVWLDEDRAWALALTDVESELCPGGCGQPIAESTAVGNDEAYDVRVTQCHACATLARRTEDRSTQGELFQVIKDPNHH
jgi:hypothetical protein